MLTNKSHFISVICEEKGFNHLLLKHKEKNQQQKRKQKTPNSMRKIRRQLKRREA